MSHDATEWARRQRAGSPARKAILLVLADMADFRGSCYPSQAYIAGITEQSERSVRDHLHALADAGLITIESRGRAGGGRSSNLYTLAMEQTGKIPGQTGDGLPERTGEPLPGNHQKNHQMNLESESASAGDPDAHAFEQFWQVYPLRRAKPDARKAWKAARRVASDMVIIAGAQAYRDDPNRSDGYTAYPATWLRREGWNDGPLPPRSGARPSGPSPRGALDERRSQPGGRLEL